MCDAPQSAFTDDGNARCEVGFVTRNICVLTAR